MALTADVKNELALVRETRNSVRAAELASLLRFSGGLHTISGRVAIEAELDSPTLAQRVRRDIGELYGIRSEILVQNPGSSGKPSLFVVRVIEGGETLARQTGLLDADFGDFVAQLVDQDLRALARQHRHAGSLRQR